jgi:hypothetical protein
MLVPCTVPTFMSAAVFRKPEERQKRSEGFILKRRRTNVRVAGHRLREEKAADKKLSGLAEGGLNRKALDTGLPPSGRRH